MKFLVDAHLPRRLARCLQNNGHDAIHTLDLPNGNRTTDQEINDVPSEVGPMIPVASLCLPALLAVAVWALCTVAKAAQPRSKKLGILAVACGIAGFIPAMIGPSFKEPAQAAALAVCGVVAIMLAVTAIALGIWTLRIRQRDRGVALRYPAGALICGAANLVLGISSFALGTSALVPVGGKAWTWRSEQHGFEVTLPSERWTAKPNPNVLAEFRCSGPVAAALVAKAFPAGSDAEYQVALAHAMQMKKETPTTSTDEHSGPNGHGHAHWTYMGDAKSGNNSYFFGVSITRVHDKAILLMFEGSYQLWSEAGHNQEARSHRSQASEFLGSVK